MRASYPTDWPHGFKSSGVTYRPVVSGGSGAVVSPMWVNKVSGFSPDTVYQDYDGALHAENNGPWDWKYVYWTENFAEAYIIGTPPGAIGFSFVPKGGVTVTSDSPWQRGEVSWDLPYLLPSLGDTINPATLTWNSLGWWDAILGRAILEQPVMGTYSTSACAGVSDFLRAPVFCAATSDYGCIAIVLNCFGDNSSADFPGLTDFLVYYES